MNIKHLKRKLKEPLPGYKSHLKMAPKHRMMGLMQTDFEQFKPKLSAVVALLYTEEGKTKIVFIRRSENVRMHPGQISFPGGRYEEGDADLEVTALREMQEEIGISPESVEVLGHLTDLYVPPSNFIVRAYVCYFSGLPQFQPQPSEVQEILAFELDRFRDASIIKTKSFATYNSEERTEAPYFDIDGTVIWGATAMMLTELMDLTG